MWVGVTISNAFICTPYRRQNLTACVFHRRPMSGCLSCFARSMTASFTSSDLLFHSILRFVPVTRPAIQQPLVTCISFLYKRSPFVAETQDCFQPRRTFVSWQSSRRPLMRDGLIG